MTNKDYLKKVIRPRDLALKVLGEPTHKQGNTFWYRSPFRAEDVASFEVGDRGFHDFGTGEHFDIISFTRKLKKCSFKEACEWLASLYGITDNEYDNKRVQRFLEQQRLAMKLYRERLDTWFLNLMNLVEEAWDDNQACIEAMNGVDDVLEILYQRQVFLGCLREDILDTDTFEKKEQLRKEITKEGLPLWIKSLKGYGLISAG